MTEKAPTNFKDVKKIAASLGIYSSASILGPLLVIGGIGYFLDRYLGTKPLLTIISIFIAFIVSNVLLYKKTMLLTRHITEIGKEGEKKEEKTNLSEQKEIDNKKEIL